MFSFFMHTRTRISFTLESNTIEQLSSLCRTICHIYRVCVCVCLFFLLLLTWTLRKFRRKKRRMTKTEHLRFFFGCCLYFRSAFNTFSCVRFRRFSKRMNNKKKQSKMHQFKGKTFDTLLIWSASGFQSQNKSHTNTFQRKQSESFNLSDIRSHTHMSNTHIHALKHIFLNIK